MLIGETGRAKPIVWRRLAPLPGRGLRGAGVAICQSNTNNTPWAISAAIIDTDGDDARLGVGRDPQRGDKKIIRYNGDPVKSQGELGQIMHHLAHPANGWLFLGGASERRRFFDRLVETFDGAHTGRMTRYENAMRERLSLLKTATEKGQKPDDTWLSALENIMAETGMAIAAARNDTLNTLQSNIMADNDDIFPLATIELHGDIEPIVQSKTALEIEDMMRGRYQQTRASDGMMGRTRYGAHCMDMHVTMPEIIPAPQCSIGEQKGCSPPLYWRMRVWWRPNSAHRPSSF